MSEQKRVLPHLNARGEVHMVRVSDKPSTPRRARARGLIYTRPEVIDAVRQGTAIKGDVLAVARVAGVMAAKHTPDWIPLAHPVALSGTEILLSLEEDHIRVEATVETVGPTGVEMEAMTAVSAALLTIYDMLKAQDRGMTMAGICLLEKSGGRSGHYVRTPEVSS